jgi:hypothetical protein
MSFPSTLPVSGPFCGLSEAFFVAFPDGRTEDNIFGRRFSVLPSTVFSTGASLFQASYPLLPFSPFSAGGVKP